MMQYKRLTVAILTAGALFTVAGCSSNQALKTTDGKTIVTDGKPQVDEDTGLVSYKNAETGNSGLEEKPITGKVQCRQLPQHDP